MKRMPFALAYGPVLGLGIFLALVLVALPTTGCGSAEPVPVDPVASDTDQTLKERLRNSPEFDLIVDRCNVDVDVNVAGTEMPDANAPPLVITGGSAVVRAGDDGALTIEALDIVFDDLYFSAEQFPPHGLHMTGVQGTLVDEVPAAASWSESGAEVVAEATIELLLDWAVVAPDGTVASLAPQHLEGIALDVRIYVHEDGELHIDADGGVDGVFWEWAGLIELSDLVFDLHGSSAP